MALPSRFSLLNANLDPFLFASIGKEESGMSLSVASALARLGSDPWIEAERLAGMPQAMAADALAAMLARMPKAGWKPSESRAIAARLVQLLPRGVTTPSPSESSKPDGRKAGVPLTWTHVLVMLLGLGLLAYTVFSMFAGR